MRMPASPARFLGPAVVTAVVAACAWALVAASHRAPTADEIVREVIETALHPARREGGEPGGLVGPWWIAAAGRGDAEDTLVNLRIVTDRGLEFAAREARVEVDPVRDTLSFRLVEVVLTRMPPEESNGSIESEVLSLPDYRLGPIPLGRDVVAGAGSDAL